MLTAMVKGSLADASHSVFLCPGDFTPTGGFQNCSLAGTFTTNINGNGAFHKEFPVAPADTVVAINVAAFATVLANCPDDMDALCDPEPLQQVGTCLITSARESGSRAERSSAACVTPPVNSLHDSHPLHQKTSRLPSNQGGGRFAQSIRPHRHRPESARKLARECGDGAAAKVGVVCS